MPLYGRINLAQSLLKSQQQSPLSNSEIAQILAVAIKDANNLGDKRAESYGLGTLGKVYQNNQQWQEAKQLTEQALILSQSSNAADISYQWQWQLGKILNSQGKKDGAIAAYSQAVESLKSLRSDLVAVNSDVQLKSYSTKVSQTDVEATLQEMLTALTVARKRVFIENFTEPAQKVYDWVIRPIEKDLAASKIKNLVFISDGSLRSIPINSLYDGEQYLAEKYSVALAPSLQLVDPKPLVLSACKTAAGDKRAALGLAGMAVRAGARSTLASLWYVSDEATAILMTKFYEELSQDNNITKAEALRRAQMAILQDQKFSHPYYWSAFVLVGNWL
ncbi:MAG: CHAT domain-containing protein [Spirulinaceae cyanobacterium]